MPKPIEDIDTGDVEPAELIDAARDRGAFVFDLETTGLNPHADRIEGIAFYIPPDPITRLGNLARTHKPALRAWYPFTDDTFRTWVQPDETPEEQSARLAFERLNGSRDTAQQIAAGQAKKKWIGLRQKSVVQNLRPMMQRSGTMEALRPLFEKSPNTVAVAHNAKFDVSFLKYASGLERGYWGVRSVVDRLAAVGRGEEDPGPDFGCKLADSMLADFLCDENPHAFGLKKRIKALFDHDMKTYTDVAKNRRQGTLAFLSDEVQCLGHYAMEDCYWTWELFENRMLELNRQTPGDPLADAVDELAAVVQGGPRPSPFDPSRTMGNLERIYWGIDMKICRLIEEMESTGILIDWQWLRKVTVQLEEKKEAIITKIEREIGWTLNPNSQPQVAALLFTPKESGGLGLPSKGIKRGASGVISTGSKEITHLTRAAPIVKDVLDWRSADTIQNNFSVKLELIARETPDQHCYSHFNQTGTKIARLSSSNPINLQNQPRDRNLIRRAFCAHLEDDLNPELILFGCDYSQIELRVAAHLSGDLGMIEVYRTGKPCTRGPSEGPCERYRHWVCESKLPDGSYCEHLWIPGDSSAAACPKCGGAKIEHQTRCRHVDLHQRTAQDAGVPRNPLAKNLNFGNLYRIGAPRFCQYANLYDKNGEMMIDYAEEVIAAWYDAYPAIRPFQELTERTLRENGWIARTITGRQRRLKDERWKNEYRAITKGIQFQVSGSAQDILKVAMFHIAEERDRRIASARPAERKLWHQWRFALQIHDELIMKGPPQLKDPIIEIMTTKMEGAASLRVPLKTDVKTGRCWDDIH